MNQTEIKQSKTGYPLMGRIAQFETLNPHYTLEVKKLCKNEGSFKYIIELINPSLLSAEENEFRIFGLEQVVGEASCDLHIRITDLLAKHFGSDTVMSINQSHNVQQLFDLSNEVLTSVYNELISYIS